MKKQEYFTATSLEKKTKEIFDEVSSFRNRRAFNLHPKRVALLILDMQEFFLNPQSHAFIPSAPAIILNLQKLISAVQQIEQPIIITKHINSSHNANQMANWWKDLITEESPFSGIIDGLTKFDNEGAITYITKTQYDAFYRTNLEELLIKENITQLIITGVMTHLCCETTVRSAFIRGFEVFFCIDGTATYSEDFHRASLLNLSHGFAIPTTTKECLSKLIKWEI